MNMRLSWEIPRRGEGVFWLAGIRRECTCFQKSLTVHPQFHQTKTRKQAKEVFTCVQEEKCLLQFKKNKLSSHSIIGPAMHFKKICRFPFLTVFEKLLGSYRSKRREKKSENSFKRISVSVRTVWTWAFRFIHHWLWLLPFISAWSLDDFLWFFINQTKMQCFQCNHGKRINAFSWLHWAILKINTERKHKGWTQIQIHSLQSRLN